MTKTQNEGSFYMGPIEVDNVRALVRIEGFEVKGDTPFEICYNNTWKRGHRAHGSDGEYFISDEGETFNLCNDINGRIYSTIPKEYFHFIKVDDYFNDKQEWHTIQKMESYHWNEEAVTLTLNLVSEDGNKCSMVIQPATGSIVRFRFHPEKQAGDYTDNNTRNIVCDKFSELFKLKRDSHFNAYISEETIEDKTAENRKFINFKFHGSLVNQLIHVRVQFDPFTIQITRDVTAGSVTEVIPVMSTPENGLCYRYSGGFDDYHIIQSVCKPATAKYVGFGEQGGMSLLKNNARVTYFNYDNMRYRQIYNRGPLEGREPLYHSDPFFMEVNAMPDKENSYAIFIDNPSETLLDMGYYYSNMYRFGIRYGTMDYYVIAGKTCGDAIKSFSNIVGNARLIPRYALGYHQGCYGYENKQDLIDAVERYRTAKIPLDGLHVDVDIQKDYKTFTIDENKFQDPKEMFSRLRKKGVKCSTNITPIISNKNTDDYSTYKEGVEHNFFVTDQRYDPNNEAGRTYYKYAGGNMYTRPFRDPEGNYNSGKPFIGEVYYGNDSQGHELGSTGCYPDFSRKEVRIWWGKQYQNLFDAGLEMVWQDMTTPCLRDTRGDMLSFPSRLLVSNDFIKDKTATSYSKDVVMKIWNLYSYNLHKATYHGLNNLKGRENKRNFIVGRGSYTGMQRFAALWTGDNSSSWDFLKINISQVLALGLTGQALSGQDIGGFESERDGERWADPELLIRWTAMGAFLPWFRNHYIRKGKKEFQEPYAYASKIGEVPADVRYMYESVLPVCKYYIELRYTLLQLFYDTTFENTLNGMPICRALFLTNPEDKALFNDKSEYMNSEFMVGNDLLIAPILEKETAENSGGLRDIYLPYGNDWYQFTNHQAPLMSSVKGGTMILDYNSKIYNDSKHIPYIVPIFVKAGAILPIIGLEQYVGELAEQGKANPITLYIYPGKQGSYTMYLDDGVSRSSQPIRDGGTDPEAKGEYREVRIDHQYTAEKTREIAIDKVHNGYRPKYEDFMYIGILHTPEEGDNAIESIEINKQPVHKVNNRAELENAGENAWYYEAFNCTTYLKLYDEDDRKAHQSGESVALREAKDVIQIAYR